MLKKLRELLGSSELFNHSFKIEDIVNFEGMKFCATDYSTMMPSRTESCTITIEVDGQTVVLKEIKEAKWFKSNETKSGHYYTNAETKLGM